MRHDGRFILVCIALFLVGGGLRLATGGLSLPWAAVAAGFPGAASTGRSEQVPSEAGTIVLDFYRAVDKGRYADAYALALENRWSQAAGDASEAVGLTAEDQFVNSLTDELGANGMSLNIISIDMFDMAPLPSVEQKPEVYPELRTLRFLPAGTRVASVYRVHVGGTLLGRCSRWDWSKQVLVAQLKGKGWRVLLPGVKGRYQPHYEEWFLDRAPQAR